MTAPCSSCPRRPCLDPCYELEEWMDGSHESDLPWYALAQVTGWTPEDSDRLASVLDEADKAGA